MKALVRAWATHSCRVPGKIGRLAPAPLVRGVTYLAPNAGVPSRPMTGSSSSSCLIGRSRFGQRFGWHQFGTGEPTKRRWPPNFRYWGRGDNVADMCAGLLYREGCVLLCKRAATRTVYPNVWDLPGGHREPEESPDQTLERELQEELGVTPVRARLLAEYQIADAGAGTAWLLVYLVTEWRGEPENRLPEEHDAVAWLTIDQANALDLASPLYPDLFRRAERQAA